MQIHFFEEFPTEENLTKLKLIKFKTRVYIAARGLREFNRKAREIKRINPNAEAAYWPILEKSYWVSPFSYRSELKGLYKELKERKPKQKLALLLDLELPVLNKKLFILNAPFFFTNKKTIRKIFREAEKLNIEISTAEYPIANRRIQKKMEWLGVSYPQSKYKHKRIIMYYSSMIKNKKAREMIKKNIAEMAGERENEEVLQAGLGTIAKGILGNEPVLKPQELDKDLSFCRENGIRTAVIFRLGGLNEEYMRIINKHWG